MPSLWTTLGKWSLLGIACIIFGFLSAESTQAEFDGILELSYEELADEEMSVLYQSWLGWDAAIKVGYYYRDQPYSNLNLQLKTPEMTLRGAYQTADREISSLQFVLYERLTLGDFRVALGEGLIFSRAGKQGIIDSPAHPNSYSPKGVALSVALEDWQALGVYSRNKRAVRLNADKISFLPKTKQDYLASSMESICSVALWRNWGFGHTGAIYYYQRYDKGFYSADQDSLMQTVGVFARADLGMHSLSMESVWQASDPSIRVEWMMRMGKFGQKWRYTSLGNYQRPAYASKAALLTTQDHRDEIMAELSYRFIPGLEMKLASVQNKRLGALTDVAGLSHNDINIRAWDADSRISLSLKIIDREILTAVDSSYVHSIPLHYRVILSGAHDISENWWLDLAARYHYQEKQASLSSGSFFRQGIGYQIPRFEAWMGFSIHSSTNYRMIVLDDSDMGYEVLGKNSLRLEMKTSLRRKNGRFTLRGRQDLKGSQSTTIDLNLSYTL
jgi:hypothetical protein